MSFEVDMDVGGSNLASGNQFATSQDPEVVAAAQPPSIDSIIKSFDKTEPKTPRKAAEEKSSPMTPSSEKKRGFNRLIDKIFMSPKSGKTGTKLSSTPMKSPAPAASPAQVFAVPSPQVRTPNMIARQASVRHMSGLPGVSLSRQASIRGSFVPSSPRGPSVSRIGASPAIPSNLNLARQGSNASIRMKKQSAWRNTTAITNPQTFAGVPASPAPAPAAAPVAAPVAEAPKEEKKVEAVVAPAEAIVAPVAVAEVPIVAAPAIISPRPVVEPAVKQEEAKVVEKADKAAEEKEHKSHKGKEDEREHKPHKSKEDKEKRRALKKKKVTEKRATETVAETPERQTERKASPPAKAAVAVEKENGSGVRAKSILSPSQSMVTLSPLANSPSRRALASHNNGSELPWLV